MFHRIYNARIGIGTVILALCAILLVLISTAMLTTIVVLNSSMVPIVCECDDGPAMVRKVIRPSDISPEPEIDDIVPEEEVDIKYWDENRLILDLVPEPNDPAPDPEPQEPEPRDPEPDRGPRDDDRNRRDENRRSNRCDRSNRQENSR